MNKHLTSFNTIGLTLCAVFALGLGWLWRPVLTNQARAGLDEGEVLGYEQFVKKNYIGVTEQGVTPTSTLDSATSEMVSLEVTSTQNNAPAITETETTQTGDVHESFTTAYNELQGVHEGVLVNLDVPYTSQAPERNWDQPWQDACEEVSVLMLDAYYKGYGLSPLFVKDEVYKMVAWQESQGWGRSISIQKVAALYEHFFPQGKKPRIVENPTSKQIKEFVRTGIPVLVVADGRDLPNQWYSGEGPEYHALIVRGYTEDSFITNDPGVNRGRNFKFPISEFMSAIHDWNNGDVQNGRPVVMVLE